MMNSLTRSVMTLATALLAVTTIGAQSGIVPGTFAVNGKGVRLQHISAVTYDTPSQGRLISILASDKPPDHKKFVEYVGPDQKPVPGMVTGAWTALHAEDKAFAGFQFTITPDRRIMLNDVLVGERNDNFSIIDDALVLELTSTSPRVAGRIRTKDPVADLGSQKVSKQGPPPDVPADNPEGTMERFAEGLRRVLAAPKPARKPSRPRRRKRRA